MYQPEYLVIALSTLGLLLRTRASHFRDAYQQAYAKQSAQRALRAVEAQARREAEEAARIKSQFLAHVSHEVRTPLNAISGAAEMLQQTALTPEQQEYVDLLTIGNETLQAILGDILDYAKIEAGKIELDPQPLRIADALEHAMKLLQAQAAAHDVQLSYHLEPGVPPVIVADPLRLRQVLLNLLSNGVKYTAAGSVTVAVTSVIGENGGDLLEIAVCDTGPGIPPHRQEALFQPFVQGPTETARYDGGAPLRGGAGLGLAISKELVTLLGGDIWVHSEVGHGSTFTFSLPLHLPR